MTARTFGHSSCAGVRAVHDVSAYAWCIFDGEACVARWEDSPPCGSPEALHRTQSPTRSRCKPVDARFCCCCSDFLVWQGLVPFTLRTGGTMPLFALSKLLLLLGTRLHISWCSRICPRPDPELLLMPAVRLLQLKRALLAVTWTVWRRLRFAT